MTCDHPHYAYLAARIAVSIFTRTLRNHFLRHMFYHVDERYGLKDSLIDEHVFRIVMENAARLDSEIIYDRDYDYDYFGFKTFERLYLMKIHGKVVERPQHMLMRVAVGIYKDDIESAIRSYHLMSQRLFTHASPTIFNAGTPRPQLSSSYLICMKDDSIEGTLQKCAVLSKSAGSISVSVHNIRGTNGMSYGIVTMLDVNQGGGAFAVYLEPWHVDISQFLELRKNHRKEEHMGRALWIPDLFMERVKSNGHWSLFCPNEAPGLADCWGSEFERLYTKYEREGKAKKVLKAQALFYDILTSQLETGMPYMLFKDSCNRKSNQQNLGTINSSSLCTGVIEYTSPTETAVCNLASIALPRFVREKDVPLDSHPSQLVGSLRSKSRYFDFDKLAEVTATVTNDLDRTIDGNYYPVETAKTSNMRHRPIGIGVQGLADAFILLGMPLDSPQAQKLNTDIFETIYYHALKASSELAARNGAYETYKGSPMSKKKTKESESFIKNVSVSEGLSLVKDYLQLSKQVTKSRGVSEDKVDGDDDSFSTDKRNAMKRARTVAMMSYFFTIIFFFCSTCYASLPMEKMWISFIFFVICTILLLPLPPIKLEKRVTKIFFYAISKSIGSFGCYYLFNWIGSSVKIETDTFLMTALLSFVFFLTSIDYLYDMDKYVGLCDGFLFTGFGLMKTQKVILQPLVLCIGPSFSLVKNYLQLSKQVMKSGGSQLSRGGIEIKGLTDDSVDMDSEYERVG